ncbi:unnamed protein product [Arabidopsis thaliana]|uniref:(thale cress) hypothetical protein n=1 Tax=Arabidopsis thaliana TaxID=3702 RepID=A0A7G2EW55_ARATH|nr:unnamed protein product [Arabidopsis thaliana]
MVITTHYVDAYWKLKKLIIGFKYVTDHKGETIAVVLLECLADWGIEKIFCVTVDNATANSNALMRFESSFSSLSNDAFVMKGEFFHMRCADHIITLIVGDGLADLDNSINAIRNVVSYVRSGTNRQKAFEQKVNSGRMTRVNITTNLRIHRNSFDSDLKKKAKDMYEKFDKYWDGLKNIKMWIVATVFDPRKKMQFANLCFADLYSEGSTNAKVLYKSVYDILVDMFKEYTGRYGKATDVQDSQSQSSQSTQEKQAETELGVKEDPSYRSIDKRYNALLNVIGVKQTKNDMYSYLKEHVENPVVFPGTKWTPLSWWKDNCGKQSTTIGCLNHFASLVQATRSYEGYWLLLSVFAVVKSHEERTQFENIEHVMNFMKRVELPVELRNSIPWIVWGLLKPRNSSVYGDRVNDHNIVIATTLEEAEEWSTQNSVASQENCSLGKRISRLSRRWSDVLFHARDSFLPMINRIEAELRCIQWSLQSLHDLHIESCEVWSDCASALQALASPEEWPKYRSQLNSSREPFAPLRSHE